MLAALIVVHLLIAVALVAVVLLQRSEGGALGIGGASRHKRAVSFLMNERMLELVF